MAKSSSIYRKLPSKRTSLIMKRSLWQGPDHLLWVKTAFLHENYKRFYYTDIQALILCRNGRQHIWTVLWGILTLIFLGITLSTSRAFYFAPVMTGVWAVCLMINLYKGPCCDVYIQTAVQFERLSHLVRVPKAVKTMERIKGLVENVQGAFSYPQEAAIDGRVENRGSASSSSDVGGEARAMPKETIRGAFSPYLHYGLFAVLLAAGFVGLAQWKFKSTILATFDLITLALILVLVIMAIARWHRHVKGTLLSALGWLSVIWGGLHLTASYILFIATNIKYPGLGHNQSEIYKLYLQMYTIDQIGVTTAIIGFALSALALGTFGLVATVEQHRSITTLDGDSPVHTQP